MISLQSYCSRSQKTFINLLRNIFLFITVLQMSILKNHQLCQAQKEQEEELQHLNLLRSILNCLNQLLVTLQDQEEKMKKRENNIIMLKRVNLLKKLQKIIFGFGTKIMDFTMACIKILQQRLQNKKKSQLSSQVLQMWLKKINIVSNVLKFWFFLKTWMIIKRRSKPMLIRNTNPEKCLINSLQFRIQSKMFRLSKIYLQKIHLQLNMILLDRLVSFNQKNLFKKSIKHSLLNQEIKNEWMFQYF